MWGTATLMTTLSCCLSRSRSSSSGRSGERTCVLDATALWHRSRRRRSRRGDKVGEEQKELNTELQRKLLSIIAINVVDFILRLGHDFIGSCLLSMLWFLFFFCSFCCDAAACGAINKENILCVFLSLVLWYSYSSSDSLLLYSISWVFLAGFWGFILERE